MNHYEMQIKSNRLKTLRLNKGWTQQHLADISGISLRTIQRAETKNTTSQETLNALAAVFEIDRNELKVIPIDDSEKKTINTKGWRIALVSIIVAQLLTVLSVWVLLGSVNILWLKLLISSWLIIGFVWFVYWLTYSTHNWKEFKDNNKAKL